jgi:propanol-preferring alcohol dehydrogenase
LRAMRYHGDAAPLREEEMPRPEPGPGQVLIRVSACGVCRTDLHIVDDELVGGTLPIVPGHEVVGIVEDSGPGGEAIAAGTRVGVPWLAWTCGECVPCSKGRENLCDHARFTGFQIDGGYAEYAVADTRYCFPIHGDYGDREAAPLLCAGLIGYRSYRMAGEAERLGLYGFGAAAHIIAQVAIAEGQRVFAFSRPGDADAQRFARGLGASWAGGSDETPPEPLDAAIIFAPVGALIPTALRAVVKGGRVVCAGIHMSDIPSFPYRLLWEERQILSVANLTRRDAEEFLALAPTIPVRCAVKTFALGEANEALRQLREGELEGAAVLEIAP